MKITSSTTMLVLVAAVLTTTTAVAAGGGFSLPMVANNLGGKYDPDGFLVAADATPTKGPSVMPPKDHTYGVALSFGTPAKGKEKRPYFLVLDTAGSLTWMQCEPCKPDLPQHGPVYDPGHSETYRPLHPTSPLCHPPNPMTPANDKCSFHVPHAHGFAGVETITLGNADGAPVVRGFVFGCAHATERFENHGYFAGKLGMGRLPTSLIMHVKDDGHAKGRFSYCLFGAGHEGKHGFLRFGDDIPATPHSHQAKILPSLQRNHHAVDSAYYVSLFSVTLNQNRVIPGMVPSMFMRHADGGGGCIIDAGTKFTYLARQAYDLLEATVATELRKYERVRDQHLRYGLCFREKPTLAADLPSMTLHFAGAKAGERADLKISPRRLFFRVENEHLMCLGVFPTDVASVVGAMQQVDTRFVFDLNAHTVTFHPATCETAVTPSEWSS